jgi:hypothetical protein
MSEIRGPRERVRSIHLSATHWFAKLNKTPDAEAVAVQMVMNPSSLFVAHNNEVNIKSGTTLTMSSMTDSPNKTNSIENSADIEATRISQNVLKEYPYVGTVK